MDWLTGGPVMSQYCNLPGFNQTGEFIINNTVFNSTIF